MGKDKIIGARYRSRACAFVGMCGCVLGCQRTPGACRWLEGNRFLVFSRLNEKTVNKLLKVLQMKTPDFRNINGVICPAAPEPIGE